MSDSSLLFVITLLWPILILARNGGTIGTNTLANAGESVGGINYQANDGSKYVQVVKPKYNKGDTTSCLILNIQHKPWQ